LWEVYAASYDCILCELPFYQEVVDRHCATMSTSGISSVLDIGAGTGSVTVRLLRGGKHVTAVDVNEAMLRRLESKITPEWSDRLTIIDDTAERLPHFPDAVFDGVTVLLAFFDMDDPIAALGEAQRVLKPGGTLVITEPRECWNLTELMTAAQEALRSRGVLERLANDWKRIQAIAPLVSDAVQDKQSRKSAEAILDILRRNGFTGLTFRESHLGNCATITGSKASLHA
jgi:ubiquinone/menaquinone biosynthesis C-methylase UbiE